MQTQPLATYAMPVLEPGHPDMTWGNAGCARQSPHHISGIDTHFADLQPKMLAAAGQLEPQHFIYLKIFRLALEVQAPYFTLMTARQVARLLDQLSDVQAAPPRTFRCLPDAPRIPCLRW